MSEFDTFDENITFPFVDNPAVTCLKGADLIKEEYKETPVSPPLNRRLSSLRWKALNVNMHASAKSEVISH
jgi:hypothetical protein